MVAFVADLKRGEPTPDAFFAAHDPRAVLWDIAIPYEANWAFFQRVAASEAAQGRAFVLTTTNKTALERLVGPTPVHEVVGKPFDIEVLAQVLRHAPTGADRTEAPPR